MAPILSSDERWLASASRLAGRGRPLARPNPAVGAVVVKDGRVVGRGWTQPGGRPHAEAVALAMAGENADGATLYATLEPCAHTSPRGPSCASLIAASGVARCIYSVKDPDKRTAGMGAAIIAKAGVAVAQKDCPASLQSLAGYLSQQHKARPYVTLKLAISLDGCIATAGGDSLWITGDIARAHVHRTRAMQDAILVGGETWRIDQPRLDVRLAGLEGRSPPQRLILSARQKPADGVQTLADPHEISRLTAVQYLYVEGGARTAAAFLKADLVDRFDLYRAPIIIGGGARSIADTGLEQLSQAHGRWQLSESRRLGSDIYEAYERIAA